MVSFRYWVVGAFFTVSSAWAMGQQPKGSVTPEDVKKGVICEFCHGPFANIKSLNRHKNNNCRKNPKWKVFACQYCGEKKNNQGSLSKHLKGCEVRKKGEREFFARTVQPLVQKIGTRDTTCRIITPKGPRTLIVPNAILPHKLALKKN